MKLTPQPTAYRFIFAALILGFAVPSGAAAPELDGVSFDPAFISAGDRVNISANLHEEDWADRNWDSDRSVKIELEPGNRLTEEYVTIEDSRDDTIGFLYPEGVWNQRFQVKVDSGAPTGSYDFELDIQYFEDGEPVRNGGKELSYIEKFSMPVDNEGVDLTSDVTSTDPHIPRPGDNTVETSVSFTNTGNKPLEDVKIIPVTPDHVSPTFSKDEKFFIGRLEQGASTSRSITLDLDEELEQGLHTVNLDARYEDTSGNAYEEKLDIPLRVEGRPDLELEDASLKMKAGSTSELQFNVTNTGEQDAESVTARLIAERSQPFSLEDRSNYIGEIRSGQSGEALLKLSSDRNAALKTHSVKVQLRATGDSEEGDSSVYTFTEDADVKLEGRTRSPLTFVGALGVLLVAGLSIYRYRIKNFEEGGERDE